MVLVTALALHTDYTHQGGLTHDFMFERPGPMTQERAADWAAQNDLPDAAESLRESVSEAAENAEEIAAIRREVGEEWRCTVAGWRELCKLASCSIKESRDFVSSHSRIMLLE